MMTANVFFQSRRLDKSRTLLPDSSDDLNEPKPLQVWSGVNVIKLFSIQILEFLDFPKNGEISPKMEESR